VIPTRQSRWILPGTWADGLFTGQRKNYAFRFNRAGHGCRRTVGWAYRHSSCRGWQVYTTERDFRPWSRRPGYRLAAEPDWERCMSRPIAAESDSQTSRHGPLRRHYQHRRQRPCLCTGIRQSFTRTASDWSGTRNVIKGTPGLPCGGQRRKHECGVSYERWSTVRGPLLALLQRSHQDPSASGWRARLTEPLTSTHD
jgi:hypothetical protein